MVARVTSVKIKVGDRAYLQNTDCRVGIVRKFCRKWDGPYRIIEKVSNVDIK